MHRNPQTEPAVARNIRDSPDEHIQQSLSDHYRSFTTCPAQPHTLAGYRSRYLSAGDAKATTPNEVTHVADAVIGVDSMKPDICTPPVAPVVVVATHEELVRSARDMWLVAVSLLTELTPDKFATAPWAAARFSVELPFLLAKLWHIQQGLITSANSYMQTETMLTTVLETIDVPKLLKELGSWALELSPLMDLPFGFTQHVPPVSIMPPTDVDIISQRFSETTWSGAPLVREENYKLSNGNGSHWFYLPKGQDWAVINGQQPMTDADYRLADFIKYRTLGNDEIHYVGESNGELVIPDAQVIRSHQGLAEGEVQVYTMQDLQNSKSLENSSTNE